MVLKIMSDSVRYRNYCVIWTVGDLIFLEHNYSSMPIAEIFVRLSQTLGSVGLMADNLILGWVNGKYEIGPRALGNRSILAAPFQESTRVRLNEIKQREQFRPIAPVCLLEDAEKWFGCHHESRYMLFTHRAKTEALAAVTHVNGTARIQTVTSATNKNLHKLLSAFKKRTGYGVLCNTSLNFNGKGFINNINDLDAYVQEHHLDGFVVEGQAYLLIDSSRYQAYKEDSAILCKK
jgi:predicted NodU family carbamoyl transferase